MILYEATIKYKGYDPEYLKPKSTLRVCCSCDQCGKVRYVRFQDYRDLCISCRRLGIKFSDETCQKMSESRKGSKHWNWNLDITDEERKIKRKYFKYQEWRLLVFKRDCFTCQCCGQYGGNLNSHHIEAYNNNKDLRTTLSNGITLCEKCHKDFHHCYGKGNNTKDQFIKFMVMMK